MNVKIIGVAGGSGSGKSTICYRLVDNYPDLFEIINLDDYQKKKNDPNLPVANGKINWDHPDIIDWGALIKDVDTLKRGNSVNLDVWSHRSNPDYHLHGKMIKRTISPKPVILLEGYLALYNQKLNKHYDAKYYLELDEKTRLARRGKNDIIGDSAYVEKILLPMHRQFVEPTKDAADKVINIANYSIDEIVELIYRDAIAPVKRDYYQPQK